MLGLNNTLLEIVNRRREDVLKQSSLVTVQALESLPMFSRSCISLKEALISKAKTGIIAEIKRASPSRGSLRSETDVKKIAMSYAESGAAAVSVLTEPRYFLGSNRDLEDARSVITIPILRKDFIFSEYQILEAKAIGADVILLIAGVLLPAEAEKLARFARSLGLEVLYEVHTLDEIRNADFEQFDIIGINNRDLRDFTVDYSRCINLSLECPQAAILVAESGISSASTILELKQRGFLGFLIGELFMQAEDPGERCRKLNQEIVDLINN